MALLNQFEARKILHVTFGLVLKERTAGGATGFGDRLIQLQRAHPEVYAANLQAHVQRRLQRCGSTSSEG